MSPEFDEFDEFAGAEMPRLLALARVLTGNDHDAWDLTQDALARVSARWDRLSHHGNLPAYARKTLANLHKNSLRGRRELLMADPPDRGTTDAPGSAGLDAWLDDAMRGLPHRQRVAVALTYLEDLPIADVASILGCRVPTAKTHLARGRDSLRRAAVAARDSAHAEGGGDGHGHR